ncbi:hypothetical protein GE09DRAFT_1223741 [Coniochaeta sp. 2T2.1]|nr:hypothetical protein GE09DRAFT_1223741 [Coniochaeta sp. 2T2.1]
MSSNQNLNISRTQPRRYSEEQIEFVLDRIANRQDIRTILSAYNACYNPQVTLSQIKYIRNIYGRDPLWGAVAVLGNQASAGAMPRGSAQRPQRIFDRPTASGPGQAQGLQTGNIGNDFDFDFNPFQVPGQEQQANAHQLLPASQEVNNPRWSNAYVSPTPAPFNFGLHALAEPEPRLDSSSQVFIGLGDDNSGNAGYAGNGNGGDDRDRVRQRVEMAEPRNRGYADRQRPAIFQRRNAMPDLWLHRAVPGRSLGRSPSLSNPEPQNPGVTEPEANAGQLVPANPVVNPLGPYDNDNPNPNHQPANLGVFFGEAQGNNNQFDLAGPNQVLNDHGFNDIMPQFGLTSGGPAAGSNTNAIQPGLDIVNAAPFGANAAMVQPAQAFNPLSPEFIQPAQMADPFRSPAAAAVPDQAQDNVIVAAADFNPADLADLDNFPPAGELDFSDLLGNTFPGEHANCPIPVRHRHDFDGGLHFDSAEVHAGMIDQLRRSVRTQVVVEEMGARVRMQEELDRLRAVQGEMAARIEALKGGDGEKSGEGRGDSVGDGGD